MELGQSVSRRNLSDSKMGIHHGQNYSRNINSLTKASPPDFDNLNHPSESFRILNMGLERAKPEEIKWAWLRSQLIGGEVEFETPFGKRILTYADHTASGRCLHYTENYIINDVLPYYGNTHTCDSFVGQRMTEMVKEASEYIKSCLGGGSDDTLLFCGSGTTAAIKRLQEVMGIAISSTIRERIVKNLSSEERWVVFVGPYEHHLNLLSWRRSLAEVVEIGLDEEGLLDMEALRLQLETYKFCNRPMLGSFSACSNVTGTYSDTRSIARLLHQYGAFACFDFAASGPFVEIDMLSGDIDGYDAIFLSPHKFLGGPGSPGILLMNKALYQLKSSSPSTCGGGTVTYVNGFNEKDTLYYDDIEEREDAGTPPIIQKIRAALAFWVKKYIGYDVIETRDRFYIDAAFKRLLPNPNIWVLGNTSVPRHSILSFLVFPTTSSSSLLYNVKSKIDSEVIERKEEGFDIWRESENKSSKPLHGAFVATLLNDLFGIQARAGCACAGPYGHHLLGIGNDQSLAFRSAIQMGYIGVKPGWTRISFSYYTCLEEFEFILAALEFIAIYGQRFLPLYHFNWKTGEWTYNKKDFKEIMRGKEHAIPQGGSLLTNTKYVMKLLENGEAKAHCNDHTNEKKDVMVISMYASYLETAKYVANLLPKFPPISMVPEDLDPDLVKFRV